MHIKNLQKSAFTLIELLVVIAIIAILAAILFPVFAQAKKAAKVTQDLSNLKNINTGNQIYLADYDDTWVPWTSAANCFRNASLCPIVGTDRDYDDGSAFGLRYMYPQLVNPYIKSGVKANSGQLNDIWASPLSKGYFPSTKYLYGYNYYALGGFSSCLASNITSGSCLTGRNASVWGPFADASYNTPASATSITDPAGMIAYADGNILMRPPQGVIALGWTDWDYIFTGVWGPSNPGDGKINGASVSSEVANAVADAGCGSTCTQRDIITASDYALATGDRTVVSYADGHVKSVNTSSILPSTMTTSKWKGAKVVTSTTADNSGWQR
jgi:prepilin-type N-terminal cleavage/methylation domain-containing protein/prepilin-type processing-associated H-X9-DG protein